MQLVNKLLVITLLMAFNTSFAQDTTKVVEDTTKLVLPDFIVTPDPEVNHQRNDVRVGFYITRISFAYDRALHDNKSSLGLEALVHLGDFPGVVGSALGRYYFREFDRTGFFLEEKLSYKTKQEEKQREVLP